MRLRDSRLELSSRRRRWLALRQVTDQAEADQVETDAATDESAPEVILEESETVIEPAEVIDQAVALQPERKPEATRAPATIAIASAVAASPAETDSSTATEFQPEVTSTARRSRSASQAKPAFSGAAEISLRLQSILRRPGAVTWMLIGESLEAVRPAQHSGPGSRTFAEHVAWQLQNRSCRRDDLCVVHQRAGERLARLVEQPLFDIVRLGPDLVFLSLSENEASSGRAGLKGFEQRLAKLIETLERANILTVLCTPFSTGEEQDLDMDRLLYAEAIRALAAEYDLPLVELAPSLTNTTSVAGVTTPAAFTDVTSLAVNSPDGIARRRVDADWPEVDHQSLADQVLQQLSTQAAVNLLP